MNPGGLKLAVGLVVAEVAAVAAAVVATGAEVMKWVCKAEETCEVLAAKPLHINCWTAGCNTRSSLPVQMFMFDILLLSYSTATEKQIETRIRSAVLFTGFLEGPGHWRLHNLLYYDNLIAVQHFQRFFICPDRLPC